MNQRLSVSFASIARGVAILFALFVVGWLVVTAQRDANRAAQEPVPAGPPLTVEAPSTAVENENEPQFLHSSKSAVIEERVRRDPGAKATAPVRAPAAPRYLPSSKTITPLVTPATPVLTLPGSKLPAIVTPQR